MNYQFSVVIPVYNGEQYIAAAITSVLNQSVQASEIIVVNDGSNDNTLNQLLEFDDQIAVINIKNQGVANARNIGVKAASHELIAFLDADDVWYKDKLKQQLSVFAKFPNVGFCCCDYQYFSRLTNEHKSFFSNFIDNPDLNFDKPLKKSPYLELMKLNYVGTCSNVIFKKSLLDKVGYFDTSLRQAEDYDMWLKLAVITDFVLLNEMLLEKNTHHSNLTNNYIQTLTSHEQVLLKQPQEPLTQSITAKNLDLYKFELAKLRYKLGDEYFENNQKVKAFRTYVTGIYTTISLQNTGLFCKVFLRKLPRLIFNKCKYNNV